MGMKQAIWIFVALTCALLHCNLPGQTIRPYNVSGKKEPLLPSNGNHSYLSSFPDAGMGKLHAAVQKIGGKPRVLHMDVNDTLGASLTIPSNIHLTHMGGAVIDLKSHTFNINGSFFAGPSQVFAGHGVVNFEKGKAPRVLPQWWGHNSSKNVQKALNTAVGCGAELFLPAGIYIFDSTVEHLFSGPAFNVPGLSIRGAGPGNTIIDNRSAGKPAFFFGTVNTIAETGLFLSIQDLEITSSTSTGSHGIQVEDIWLGRISNCFIHELSGDGILMRSDEIDFGLPKTWRIERTLLYKNSGYGLRFESVKNTNTAYNIVMDQLDVEQNKLGGVFAAAELTKITNSIFAYNGDTPFSHGGIHITGVNGVAVTENVIQGNGFEANYPYDIYADRFLNLKIEQNDMSRIPYKGSAKPDNFIRLNGPFVGINANVTNNHFSSANPNDPFTAVLGGSNLENVQLNNNRFNIMSTDKRYEFDIATKVTYCEKGDMVLTNQTIGFSNSVTAKTDTLIKRACPGILKVTGGVANAFQKADSFNNQLIIDCKKGLNVSHTLKGNITIAPPTNATDGVILNLVVFQGQGGNYTISFDPIFKCAEPFTVSGLHFSTIRFLYTGLYWIQLGGAAIDAPL